jgi:hypothetical protein
MPREILPRGSVRGSDEPPFTISIALWGAGDVTVRALSQMQVDRDAPCVTNVPRRTVAGGANFKAEIGDGTRRLVPTKVRLWIKPSASQLTGPCRPNAWATVRQIAGQPSQIDF